jgi:hypothetical protein
MMLQLLSSHTDIFLRGVWGGHTAAFSPFNLHHHPSSPGLEVDALSPFMMLTEGTAHKVWKGQGAKEKDHSTWEGQSQENGLIINPCFVAE